MTHYMLDDNGQVITTEDTLEWGKWFGEASEQRIVAKDTLADDVSVSTVFLGIDHNWGGGPPILWGTMVFGGHFDQEQERYSSRPDAEVGHARWVEKVRGGS